jgi:hypothetical protein
MPSYVPHPKTPTTDLQTRFAQALALGLGPTEAARVVGYANPSVAGARLGRDPRIRAIAHWERAQWEPRAAARSPVSAALPSEAIAGRSQVSKVSVSALHSGGISP